jgi:alpha-1,6-mannosyltransferase
MKILQVANFVSPKSGGLRTAIDALRNGYEEMGWSVYRLTPFPDPQQQLDVYGVGSVRVPTMHSYHVILQRRSVQAAIRDINPDVIELSDKSTLAWLPKWAKENGIPCCVISHERMDLTLRHAGVVSLPLRKLSQNWTSQIVEHASRIVCASQFAAVEFQDCNVDTEIIPLGINLDTIRPIASRKIGNSTIKVVMCTRLSEEKKPHVGIEAIRLLAQKRDVQLIIMGDGPSRRRLEKLASGLDVQFVGHVADRQRVLRELGSADVVLNLGPVETFGLVTLEALAAGTPVVVANSGASPELITPDCGRAVSTDAVSVARGIEEIVAMSDETTSANCRMRAGQFRWSNTVSRFAQLYLALAKTYEYAS